METSATESSIIYSLTTIIAHAIGRLPGRVSSMSEQRRQGGALFPMAFAFVSIIVRALERHPELYPDLCAQAPALREHQERAGSWFDLEMFGQFIVTYARMNYVREQSEAVTEARAIMDRILLIGQHPELLPGVNHDLRLASVAPAYLALRRHFDRLRQLQGLARQSKAAGLPARSPRSPTGPTRKDQQESDARAKLLETFADAQRDRSRK